MSESTVIVIAVLLYVFGAVGWITIFVDRVNGEDTITKMGLIVALLWFIWLPVLGFLKIITMGEFDIKALLEPYEDDNNK